MNYDFTMMMTKMMKMTMMKMRMMMIIMMIMRFNKKLKPAYLRPSSLSMVHALTDEICPHGVNLEERGIRNGGEYIISTTSFHSYLYFLKKSLLIVDIKCGAK